MEAQKIILEPILTEKSYAGIPNKVYTFKVATDANKIEIKKAVEELFEVQVERVNTVNCRGKLKTRNTRRGQVVGSTSAYKKAIVFLKPESKAIAFFESLN